MRDGIASKQQSKNNLPWLIDRPLSLSFENPTMKNSPNVNHSYSSRARQVSHSNAHSLIRMMHNLIRMCLFIEHERSVYQEVN